VLSDPFAGMVAPARKHGLGSRTATPPAGSAPFTVEFIQSPPQFAA
jgi:hypothetical protein